MQLPDQTPSEIERKRKHAEAQQRYFNKQRLGWQAYSESSDALNNINNLIPQLNSRLSEQQTSIIILQSQLNERNYTISLLQQLLNEREIYRSQLQTQLNENIATISTLNQQLSVRQHNIQSPDVDSEPNLLQARNQLTQKDQIITQLQLQISELTNRITSLTSTNTEKDQTIAQLQSRLNNCVTTDVDRRLLELNTALENNIQREQLCLSTINQLNFDNSSLKIYRDIITDLNNKYPKLLTSFVSEIQRPGNESSHPEINSWARDQMSRILPSDILSLSAFTNQGQSPVFQPSGSQTPDYVSNQLQAIGSQIPVNVSTQQFHMFYNENDIPEYQIIPNNINSAVLNQSDLRKFAYLHNNGKLLQPLYKRLYKRLYARYNRSPSDYI